MKIENSVFGFERFGDLVQVQEISVKQHQAMCWIQHELNNR